ncbi:MAG: ATP-binding cassette domain-containing protein [Alphaproteobacteria bacterium]
MTLALKDIAKSFGGAGVLHGLTIDFEPGKVTALVGDNGAGKSTLLKVIAGLYAPDQGHVMLNGADITGLSPHERRAAGIEMVFQDLALAGQQDIVSNIFMGREIYAPFTGFLDRRRMEHIARTELDSLGIQIPDFGMPVQLLSGGQQQAVAIARAAIFDPQILLLDEPTAALAAREVGEVLDLIRGQRDHGRTVILVSHRLNDVFAVADRIVIVKHGLIASDLPAAETSLSKTIEMMVS